MAPLLGPTGAPIGLDEVNDAVLRFLGAFSTPPPAAATPAAG
jgi:hypothetical protein